MAEISGPTYHRIKQEIRVVQEQLATIYRNSADADPIRHRIDDALRDLEIACAVLYCGQTQSALDVVARDPESIPAVKDVFCK